MTFEKQWFYLDNVIGHSYGTTFEVTGGGSLQPKKKKEEEPTAGAVRDLSASASPSVLSRLARWNGRNTVLPSTAS